MGGAAHHAPRRRRVQRGDRPGPAGPRRSWVGRVGGDEFGAPGPARAARRGGRRQARGARRRRTSTGLMFLEQRTAGRHPGRLPPCRLRRVRPRASTTCGRPWRTPPSVLHLTGITPALSDEAAAAVQLGGRVAAAAAGAFVSLDVNYRARLWSRAGRATRSVRARRHGDAGVASEDELDLVAGGDSEDAAAEALLRRRRPAGRRQAGRRRRECLDAPTAGSTSRPSRSPPWTPSARATPSGRLPVRPPRRRRRPRRVSSAEPSSARSASAGRGDWESLPRRDELDLLNHHPGSALR